jgi:intein-encoded DNA endonuclease-like protein
MMRSANELYGCVATFRAWTKAEDDLAISMLKDGASLQEVADKLGRTYKAVNHRSHRKWRVQTHYRLTKWNKLASVTKKELERLYWQEELSLKEIGQMYGATGQSVRYKMHKIGIPLERKRRHMIKPKLINDENLCYILGVLAGDGSVHNNSVSLCVTSKIFAESFARALRSVGLNPWVSKNPHRWKNPNWKPQYQVVATSKRFYEWYKSLSLDDIKRIIIEKKEHALAFLRGYFESDGHNGKYQLFLTDEDKKLLELAAELLKGLGYESCIEDLQGFSRLYIHGSRAQKDSLIRMLNPCIRNQQFSAGQALSYLTPGPNL